MMATPGSLENLNPIVVPDPVGWLPLAPGWKVLLVVAVFLSLIASWRWWLSWRDDRYRREALRELRSWNTTSQLPDLLRRTALSAFPRDQVAPLVGPAWHRFLDGSAGQTLFDGAVGNLLDRCAYGGEILDEEEARRLCEAVKTWILNHQRPS